MRFKVPQSIDMPDRIVGPLTMIQFVEAVLGGGLAYICYNALPAPLSFLAAIIVAVLTCAIVLVKINERPFLFFFMAFIKFLVTPKQRIWQKDQVDNFEVEIYKPPVKEDHHTNTKALDRDQIEKLANSLDTQGIDKINLGR